MRGPERAAEAFQGMVKASVMHAGESGLPSEAIQHAAAIMTTPEWEEAGRGTLFRVPDIRIR